MHDLATRLVDAEKQWQQAIAQAAYWQGKVEVLREMAGQAQAELPGVTTTADNGVDPSA